MRRGFLAWLSATIAVMTLLLPPASAAQDANDKKLEQEFEESGDEHMRLELGVNEMTTPPISTVLRELGSFQPVPFDLIAQNNRDAVYANRMQTALHFGSLVADGFMLTIAERPADIQDIGKALIRQSRALGVGDRLTKRSKSLFDLSDKGDWAGMRQELIRTQGDVEQSMMDLRDEEMAHMISLGGWLRGFQLAARSCSTHYNPERSRILANADIIDYFLDRLGTLHPRLAKTEFATELTAALRELRSLVEGASNEGILTQEQTTKASAIADRAVSIALGPVDAEGRILKPRPEGGN